MYLQLKYNLFKGAVLLRPYFILLYIACACFFAEHTFAQSKHVVFETSVGDIRVELFDDTPRHRDMFLQAVADSTYHDALFNRVIAGFVNQGGELDDQILADEARGDRERYRLPAEIHSHHTHVKGALGAGRDANPAKGSYRTQLYFVVGRLWSAEELEQLEHSMQRTLSAEAKAQYQFVGGTPQLDGDYTVFGRILEGIEVLEQINQTETTHEDVPVVPVRFSVYVANPSKAIP